MSSSASSSSGSVGKGIMTGFLDFDFECKVCPRWTVHFSPSLTIIPCLGMAIDSVRKMVHHALCLHHGCASDIPVLSC